MATKNTLGDMHMMLMEQLQRLNECDTGSEDLRREVDRGNAMANVSKQVVANASLIMKASQASMRDSMPHMLTAGDDA